MDFNVVRLVVISSLLLLWCSSARSQTSGQSIQLHFYESGSDSTIFEKGYAMLTGSQSQFKEITGGHVSFGNITPGLYGLHIQINGYSDLLTKVHVKSGKLRYNFYLTRMREDLTTTFIDINRPGFVIETPDISGTTIYLGKKSEMFKPKETSVNLAANSARQLYQTIPGLNIWENDASGVQLNIGARGLNPNRTSNFNTRQNGHDISADALGYPESYYTPPAEAVERIEFIRGAASLQYGPHFGGLINYKMKDHENKRLLVRQTTSLGSFDFFQSFTSIGGQSKNHKYYLFYQRRSGRQYRPNSNFEQNTAYASYKLKANAKTSIAFGYTHMDYLAQQPGGLVDYEFNQDPYQVKRERNWFHVDWNIWNANVDVKLNDSTRFNAVFFYLHADRMSVGELSRPHRPDPGRERDLIAGQFRNFGTEWRLLHSYKMFKKYPATFLSGIRLYRGLTRNQQGFANAETGPSFNFLSPEDPGVSHYRFPAKNLSAFVENVVQLKNRWFLTPGMRMEWIRTTVEGDYKSRLLSGGQVIFADTIQVARSNTRKFPLFGMGLSHRTKKDFEWMVNLTQNYKAINFSDLTINNPNLVLDSNLQDESGYNIDLGVSGQTLKNALWFNVSLFYLKYNNRIGLGEIDVLRNGITQMVAYRTNIGNAYSTGIESFVDLNVLRALNKTSKMWKVNWFANGSYIHGRYLTGKPEFVGNQLEFVVPWLCKSGVRIKRNKFYLTYQLTYQSQQFTDATNAIQVVDATRGIIPAFSLHDVQFGFKRKQLGVKLSVNNVGNRAYFTRRALSYPGPGIITAEPRSFYVTLRYYVGTKN